MTVFRVQVWQVGETPMAVVSSFRATRTSTKTEFYASKEKAEARMAELRNSITMLSGHTQTFEIDITPIEVIE